MNITSTSLVKISRPTLKEVLLRERLFARLDELMDTSVVWVSGPPGSGKTTLVSSYIESRGLKNIWYQVDSGDTDVATFFHFMGLGAKKAAPRKRKPLPTLTPESLLRLSIFTRHFFQDLFDRIKNPSVVVLDNYQDALDDETFNGIIRDGLSVVPEGITVIVIRQRAACAISPNEDIPSA